MSSIAMHSQCACAFTLVFDDRCVMVRTLAQLVRLWDRHRTFDLVGRNRADEKAKELLADLDNCPWSLLLIGEQNQRWTGPEAIPIILKSLPFGKLAAVAYILPGTMWLTRQFYLAVSRLSRNHRQFA